jgi:putative ABC transport system permease protein
MSNRQIVHAEPTMGTVRTVVPIGIGDHFRLASLGLATRRLRASLSALGIAIGIAALVAVLGLSASSQADLVNRLQALGTNLLTVKPGQNLFGEAAKLPAPATAMVGRIATVSNAASVSTLDGVSVRRSKLIPATETGGLSVNAVSLNLLDTLRATIQTGRWLNESTSQYPTVVLGTGAAKKLGIADLSVPIRVWIGDDWFTVAGILNSVTLAPDLNDGALIGEPIARKLYVADLRPSVIHVRVAEGQVDATRTLLGRTANPEKPSETNVSRPSDALSAQVAAKGAFTSLFIGLGAVALLVGAVGIANVMVIAVLERRREIGLRRALGATRRHVTTQFLSEALLLSAIGAIVGVLLGAGLTVGYAWFKHWPPVVPPKSIFIGIGTGLAIGAIAGLYPAMRASRLSPTVALQSA